MSDQAPAGWYPQTDGSQRYWDGSAWTDQVTSAAPVAPEAPTPSTASTQPVSPYADPVGDQPAIPTYAAAQPVPQQMVVAPKNPAVSLLASFFIPGLGSMINGDVGKGVGILAGFIVSAVLTIIVIGFVGLVGFWIWGMVDGYQGAQKWNAKHGILS